MLLKSGLIVVILFAAVGRASAQTADVIGEVGDLLGQLGAPQPKLPPLDRRKMDAAWGTAVGGLQAGIRLAPGSAATFDIVIRNVGKEPVTISHLNLGFGGENVSGTVTAKPVELTSTFIPPGKRSSAKLAPNESRFLGSLSTLAPGATPEKNRPAAALQRGVNRLGAEAISIRLDSGKDLELATGHLDLTWPPARK
jgi:hypothetical protein